MSPLNPIAVRERSKSVLGCREVYPGGPYVISFVVGLNQNSADDLARVNIFFNTGTVSTARVLGGKLRQTFRRNVTSLDVIEQLLKHPEKLIEIDDSLVGFHDISKAGACPISPRSIQKELELAHVGQCILQGEKEKLEKHLENIAEMKPRPQSEAILKGPFADNHNKDDDNSGSSNSAQDDMEYQFSLPTAVMDQVDQCLRDIRKLKKIIKGVATNGKGTVFLYGNGGVAYTPSIPKAMYQKLRQLRESSFRARPKYIALGTRDRYFVSFNDGSADWKGPKVLDKLLKKCTQEKKMPRSVSFGSSYDTFFVVFHDGSWKYQGRGIPQSLEEKLEERDCRYALLFIAC
jgi:hypothetical protein